jgi:hypothetical protein
MRLNNKCISQQQNIFGLKAIITLIFNNVIMCIAVSNWYSISICLYVAASFIFLARFYLFYVSFICSDF